MPSAPDHSAGEEEDCPPESDVPHESEREEPTLVEETKDQFEKFEEAAGLARGLTPERVAVFVEVLNRSATAIQRGDFKEEDAKSLVRDVRDIYAVIGDGRFDLTVLRTHTFFTNLSDKTGVGTPLPFVLDAVAGALFRMYDGRREDALDVADAISELLDC